MLKENLFKALAGILLLIVVMAALGYWFDEQMRFATNWVVEQIGFAGLCLILFVTDTLVTPISPDILLVVIAHSALAEHWLFYVSILGLVSVASGMLGWCIGRWLSHFTVVQSLFGQFNQDQRRFIQKYGFWAIVLGATTPLPYSMTCSGPPAWCRLNGQQCWPLRSYFAFPASSSITCSSHRPAIFLPENLTTR